jgi:DNA gyrase subunit A
MGRVFQTRVWDIPQGSRTSKGKAIVNLITLRPGEKVTSLLAFNPNELQDKEHAQVVMVTKKGTVKKTAFMEYANIRSNGLIAIKLETDDELLWVKLTDSKMNVMLITSMGKAIIFKEGEVRNTGRSSIGVKGIELEKSDYVVSADVFSNVDLKKDILVIGEKGVGKRTNLSKFKDQHRGGKGVKVAPVDGKMGHIAFVQVINPEDTTIIITSTSGQVVKIPLEGIPTYSREAKGVILMRFSNKEDKVVSATFV